MAIVTIDVVGNSLTASQKRDMIHLVTEAVLTVEGEAMRDLAVVRINELAEGHFAVGGRTVTAEDLYLRFSLPAQNEHKAFEGGPAKTGPASQSEVRALD